MKFPLRIVMVSFYGQGLSNPAVQLSGALARQRDYAADVELYHLVVPAAGDSEEPIMVTEHLLVHPVLSTNPLQFWWRARQRVQQLQPRYQYTTLMVDNPHLGGLLGVWLKWKLKLPLVVHAMGDMIRNPWYSREKVSNRLKDIATEVAVRYADVIRVSTEAEVERLQTSSFAKKIMRVSFYVDQAEILRQLSACTVSKAEKPTALYVGRLGSQKDLSTLLAAWDIVVQQLPEAQLLIVGGGPQAARLQAEAELRGCAESITFTGPVPYEQVMQYFAQAHTFVMSSLFEGTCMVLHEAGLAQLPVVTTAFAGARDIVRDGETGFIVPIRDQEALAKKMIAVLGDTELADQLGTAFAAVVTQYDKGYALNQWRTLCERLVTLK